MMRYQTLVFCWILVAVVGAQEEGGPSDFPSSTSVGLPQSDAPSPGAMMLTAEPTVTLNPSTSFMPTVSPTITAQPTLTVYPTGESTESVVCSICRGGTNMTEPDKEMTFRQGGVTCAFGQEYISGATTLDNCEERKNTFAEYSVDVASWCGCEGEANAPPNLCSPLCNEGEAYIDPTRKISIKDIETTCEGSEAFVPYIDDESYCFALDGLKFQCCPQSPSDDATGGETSNGPHRIQNLFLRKSLASVLCWDVARILLLMVVV